MPGLALPRQQAMIEYFEYFEYSEYVVPCVMSRATRVPLTLPAAEQVQVRDLERMLDLGAPALVSVSGERFVVPPTVYEVLRKVVEFMAQGRSVTLLPDNQVVTTQ